MKILPLLLLLALALTGCAADPFGATERSTIQANARIAVAQADSSARVAVAQAHANAASVAAIQETVRTQTWAAVLPIALILLGVAVVAAIIAWWAGRTRYTVAVAHATGYAPDPTYLPSPRYKSARALTGAPAHKALVDEYAHTTGALTVELTEDGYYRLLYADRKPLLMLPKDK